VVPRSLEERSRERAAVSALRFLVVRYSAIGDCVMAVPVAARIRSSHPDALIGWAVETRCSDVVDSERLVNVRAEMPRHEWKGRAWSPRIWRAHLRYYAELRKLRFDYGLDLQGHSKTAICLRLANPQTRAAAQATDPFARLLNPQLPAPNGKLHTVERNLLALKHLGFDDGSAEPMMPALERERAEARASKSGNQRLVTVMVGASAANKLGPPDFWAEAAARLIGLGHQVALIGGPCDRCPEVPGAIDLVGKTSLRQAMGWIAESHVHVAPDTGTGHIAAAYGVPVVSVFGPSDPDVFRPYTDRGVVLKPGLGGESVEVPGLVEAVKEMLDRYAEAISH
jgi:ADP-heptose:LPS heptosyltransferase